MNVEVKKISVKVAKELLATNVNFRKLDEKRARNLAREITEGRWELNGESIKLDKDGRLVDGQHRLKAIVIAGKEVQSVVVKGVNDILEIDRGVNRTLASYLSNLGYKHTSVLAAVVRKFWGLEKGLAVGESNPRLGVKEGMDLLKKNKGMTDSVELTTAIRRTNIIPHSALAFLHYVFSQKDEELAGHFVEAVINGGLEKNDTVMKFREKMIAGRINNRMRFTRTEVLALAIKSWNYWREGVEVSELKWMHVGPHTEKFPKVK